VFANPGSRRRGRSTLRKRNGSTSAPPGLVIFIVEVMSGIVESAVLERYIEGLTAAANTMRQNRRAIVKTAENLHVELLRIELIAGTVGNGKNCNLGACHVLLCLIPLRRA